MTRRQRSNASSRSLRAARRLHSAGPTKATSATLCQVPRPTRCVGHMPHAALLRWVCGVIRCKRGYLEFGCCAAPRSQSGLGSIVAIVKEDAVAWASSAHLPHPTLRLMVPCSLAAVQLDIVSDEHAACVLARHRVSHDLRWQVHDTSRVTTGSE